MTVWAGVDIGNASTEVVLCHRGRTGMELLGSARTPTRGGKGSAASLQGAARVVRRLASSREVRIDTVAFAPTAPVESALDRELTAPPDTGRLTAITRSSDTVAGDGAVVGVPRPVDRLRPGNQPTVVCVPRGHGYGPAAEAIATARKVGTHVVGVLVAEDEAVLVANRIEGDIPVVDGIDIETCLAADLVAMEVSRSGPLRHCSDAYWLTHHLQLAGDDASAARAVADQVRDSTSAVICRGLPRRRETMPEPPRAPKGTLTHTLDLGEVASQAGIRRGMVAADLRVMSTMRSGTAPTHGCAELEELLQVSVVTSGTESEAARAGALTTPGVDEGVVVVDVGGGTVDVVTAELRTTMPGAGQMLTAAAAHALVVSQSIAEYAKRTESKLCVSAQLLEDEHGRREFASPPLNSRNVGWLLTPSPSGLLPFTSRLSLHEWRRWRHVAKELSIAHNVRRGLVHLPEPPNGVLLVGGGAGDDELVRAVSASLDGAVSIGRGDVAGTLGHRFSVAYGLVELASPTPCHRSAPGGSNEH